MTILGISGSLREGSFNTVLLRTAGGDRRRKPGELRGRACADGPAPSHVIG